MATPNASPQVASTIGLKNVVIAPLTADTEEGHTYGDLQLMAGAIEASITPENADPVSRPCTKFYRNLNNSVRNTKLFSSHRYNFN